MKTNTKVTKLKRKKKGFTLIEVIAVLVLLGILAAIALPAYIDLSDNAEDRALEAGIAELNSREAATWGNTLLGTSGWTVDALPSNTALGDDYTWTSGPLTSGGTLKFRGKSQDLARTASTATSPARWTVAP